jgi:ankyrin repeat protein
MAADDDEEPSFARQLEREALCFAAGDGDLRRVKELLAEGYPVNAFDDLSWTPLHHAARKEYLAVVRHLIAAGADVNAHEEERIGDTVLKHVAQTCSLELARILLDAGADPTVPGWMQLTALDKSVTRKRFEGPEVHRLLVDAARRCNPRWARLEEFSGKLTKKGKR